MQSVVRVNFSIVVFYYLYLFASILFIQIYHHPQHLKVLSAYISTKRQYYFSLFHCLLCLPLPVCFYHIYSSLPLSLKLERILITSICFTNVLKTFILHLSIAIFLHLYMFASLLFIKVYKHTRNCKKTNKRKKQEERLDRV